MANEMRDRLIKDLRISKTEWLEKECDHETNKELVEYVADYLIDDGWVRPPCSLHQTLWEITWNKRIEQCKVSSLTQKADGSFKIRISPKCSGVYEITPDKIGEKVFLTKAEAEQKLKEMRGGKNA